MNRSQYESVPITLDEKAYPESSFIILYLTPTAQFREIKAVPSTVRRKYSIAASENISSVPKKIPQTKAFYKELEGVTVNVPAMILNSCWVVTLMQKLIGSQYTISR